MSESVSQSKPKFLLDENVRRELLDFLKSKKYDANIKSKGLGNGKLAKFTLEEKRILVTNDRDFTYSEQFSEEKIFSVIWLRIPQNKSDVLIKIFSKMLAEVKVSDFKGNLIILYENKYTVESIPSSEMI